MVDSVFDTIKKRRTIHRFEDKPVDEEKIKKILNAGRWAPSWTNSQPWKFAIIRDQETKDEISEVVATVFNKAIREAPVSIVIGVNPKDDPFHYVEDGAAATQNMALMAESLGLGSAWIGIFSLPEKDESSEEVVKEVVGLPKNLRIISILPVGYPKKIPEKGRKDLSSLMV